MRVIKVLLLGLVLAACGSSATAMASTGPNSTYTLKCPGCAAIIAATESPAGDFIVMGGNSAFTLLDLTKKNWSWVQNFVDYGSEQEGPFAWADLDLFAGMAPDSGTVETMWAITAGNGSTKWSVGDDGSMSQVSLTSMPGAFFSGSITSNAVERYDAKTGKKAWGVQLNDYLFNMIAARLSHHNESSTQADKFAVVVACGNAAYGYDADDGAGTWNVTDLATQLAVMAVDEPSTTAFFAGATDADGNTLSYTTVYAFDYVTGAQKWNVNVSGVALTANLQAFGDAVFAYTTNGVWVLDAKTGHARWNTTLYTPTSNQVPAATPGRWSDSAVLFASVAGIDLTALDLKDGKSLWTVPFGQGLLASLAPVVTKKTNQLVVPVASPGDSHGFVQVFDMPAH